MCGTRIKRISVALFWSTKPFFLVPLEAEEAAQGVGVGAGAGEEQLQPVEGHEEGEEAAVLAEPEARVNVNRGTRGSACCDTTPSQSRKKNLMRN